MKIQVLLLDVGMSPEPGLLVFSPPFSGASDLEKVNHFKKCDLRKENDLRGKMFKAFINILYFCLRKKPSSQIPLEGIKIGGLVSNWYFYRIHANW